MATMWRDVQGVREIDGRKIADLMPQCDGREDALWLPDNAVEIDEDSVIAFEPTSSDVYDSPWGCGTIYTTDCVRRIGTYSISYGVAS